MFPSCPNVLLAFVTQLCPNGFCTDLCQSGYSLIHFNAVNAHYFQYSWRRAAPLGKTMFRHWYGRYSVSHWLSSWALSQKPARLYSHHSSQGLIPLLAQKSTSNFTSKIFSAGNHICSGPNTVFSGTSPLPHTGIVSHHLHISLGFPGLTEQVLLASSQTQSVLSPCQRNPPLHFVQWQPPDPWHRTHHLNSKFPYLHWELFQEGDLSFDLSALGQSVFSSAWALLHISSEQLLPCSGADYPCIFMPFLFLPSKGVSCSLRMTSWSFPKLMANGSVVAPDTWSDPWMWSFKTHLLTRSNGWHVKLRGKTMPRYKWSSTLLEHLHM